MTFIFIYWHRDHPLQAYLQLEQLCDEQEEHPPPPADAALKPPEEVREPNENVDNLRFVSFLPHAGQTISSGLKLTGQILSKLFPQDSQINS